MGWLRDVLTGYSYKLTYHHGIHDERYTLDASSAKMTLIGPGIGSSRGARRPLHSYVEPKVDVFRKSGGPASVAGMDKGRWFITLWDAAGENPYPVMNFQCRNKAEAMGIKRRADRLRGEKPSL